MTEAKLRIIQNRRASAIAVVLIAVVWILNVRSLFKSSSHSAATVLPWHFGFLGRTAWIGDLVFYVWIVWVSIATLRTTAGRERIFFAGFLFPILLIPLKCVFSGLPLAAIQYVTTASVTVALVAALLILRDQWSTREG